MIKVKNILSNGKWVFFDKKSSNIDNKLLIMDKTLWANCKTIANIFNENEFVVQKHIKDIFEYGVLDKKQVCSLIRYTNNDRKRYEDEFYNLDAIIFIGYRVNAKMVAEFRMWANKVINEYMINRHRNEKKKIEEITLFELASIVSNLDKYSNISEEYRKELLSIYYEAQEKAKITGNWNVTVHIENKNELTEFFNKSNKKKLERKK